MGKRMLVEPSPEDTVTKKRRTCFETDYEFSSGGVQIIRHFPGKNDGIVQEEDYTSTKEQVSIQHVMGQVEQDVELTIDLEIYDLYPAFKEALLRLLAKINEVMREEDSEVRIILIHGVPNVGKTSLAKCLSYYLALSTVRRETVHYKKLSHSAKEDSEALTDTITSACSRRYLVLDQVNTNALQWLRIRKVAERRFTAGSMRMPLIMFTSGHYTPSEAWMDMEKAGLLCYMLINMQIDAATVSKLRQSKKKQECIIMSDDDLLEVTTSYSRMERCLGHLYFCDPYATKSGLGNVIYPCAADIKLIQTKSAIHFVWLAWQKFVTEGLPTLEEFTEDDCILDPCHMQYLGHLISGIKGTRDKGTNALLYSMDIAGDKNYEKNGYSEFQSDTYGYKILHKNKLYDALSNAARAYKELLRDESYSILTDAFNQLSRDDDIQYQYVMSGLFRLIIGAMCDKQSEETGRPVGMARTAIGIDFIGVHGCEAVSNEIDLCAVPKNREVCKTGGAFFWCVFNVSDKRAFKGFDFAFMETVPCGGEPKVCKLQLFQVSVNPGRKSHDSKLAMTDALDAITSQLLKEKLIKDSEADKVITPYFVHPETANETIVSPYRNSYKLISVDVPSFPQKYLQRKQ